MRAQSFERARMTSPLSSLISIYLYDIIQSLVAKVRIAYPGKTVVLTQKT